LLPPLFQSKLPSISGSI